MTRFNRQNAPSDDPVTCWLDWVGEEERKRLGWFAFMMDLENAALYRHFLMVSSPFHYPNNVLSRSLSLSTQIAVAIRSGPVADPYRFTAIPWRSPSRLRPPHGSQKTLTNGRPICGLHSPSPLPHFVPH